MERRRTYSTSFIGSRKKIKACFCGGTSMTPEYVSLLLEEEPKNKAQFVPTYGNTLMRLAVSIPEELKDNYYSVTYYAP